jgi:hypothetical protein
VLHGGWDDHEARPASTSTVMHMLRCRSTALVSAIRTYEEGDQLSAAEVASLDSSLVYPKLVSQAGRCEVQETLVVRYLLQTASDLVSLLP